MVVRRRLRLVAHPIPVRQSRRRATEPVASLERLVRSGSVKLVAASVGERAQVVAALHAFLAEAGDKAALPHFVARISSWAKSALRIDIYLRRTYSGRPSFSIRLSDATPMATSVVCRPSVRERSASPITRL